MLMCARFSLVTIQQEQRERGISQREDVIMTVQHLLLDESGVSATGLNSQKWNGNCSTKKKKMCL